MLRLPLVAFITTLLLSPFAQATEAALANRIDRISQGWLGKPYLIDPLGEGSRARFDRDPRLRTDGFDCTTFVETVIATAKSSHPDEVLGWMDRLRYENGKIGFVTRNHFPGLDWIRNNESIGIVRDITVSLAPTRVQFAEALVEKDEWYKRLKADRLSGVPVHEQANRIQELRSMSRMVGKELERVPYLTKQQIVSDSTLVKSIPHGAIVNIVRPSWDLRSLIGTRLNISHQGFAIHKNGTVYYRQASSDKRVVVDEPLIEYMRRMLKSKTVQGINVLEVR